ncbi:cation diffusion facilitator family transporter [Bacillus carboniphilus]|uniref:Cation diffusion facilitator family transporter n=1 Tax=Bacillus carboniphilus TaxID=86663 RepID=A0ABY9JTS8_9BACI|nr:cation diffusion facilitator family transporter [Bacillus carboniphilus]WLR42762.1 cation diffusion facilitator family transporter [Bacillus carboniphilus]
MAHSHDHQHHSHHNANKRALFLSFILISTYMVIEVIGGLLTNSLALLSDAGHMLSDAGALGLSLVALKMGERKNSSTKTYGYKRFEIIAAFINGLTLILIAVYISFEAIQRFITPQEVSGKMLFIASIGLIVNIAAAFILMRGDNDNLNIKSAFLHVLSDLLGSVGAIIAGLFIIFFGWYTADPIASIIVSVLVLISGVRVTKDSFHILMEGKPKQYNDQEVKQQLRIIDGVIDIHDLHIWSISSSFPVLTCHLVINQEKDSSQILKEATALIKEQFHIDHVTIQIEREHEIPHTKNSTCRENEK